MNNLNKHTELGISILEAIDNGNILSLENLFESSNRNVDEITELEGWSWIHKSLLGYDRHNPPSESIKYLIKKGNSVNLQDMYGMTPLHYAMRGKNVECAKVLLEAGADPNIENKKHLTPLNYINGMPEELDLLELMLKKGANPNHSNGQHGILEGIKKYRGDKSEFTPVIKMMEKYV